MKQKRKDKNQMEKEALDDLKEVKALMAEGKTALDKANTPHEIEEALNTFHKAISKTNANNQISQANQLYHLRGLCHFKLRQFEQAEKDLQ